MGMSFKYPPETFDGKQLVTANALPEWCILHQSGRGDTESAIGGGDLFEIQCSDPNSPSSMQFRFIDAVYVTSGVGVVKDAEYGDHIDFEVIAPATVPTPNGAGTGNCNKVPTGTGFDIIVPAMGNGAYDLDLSSTGCHLVPNADSAGYWNWDMPKTGAGTVTPAAANGGYDLFTIGMRLARFATDVPLLGTDVVLRFGIENVRAKMVPPHWDWLVTLHCGAAGHTVKVGFFLQTGRARSYLPTQIPMV
jgi:hypothetical protein